MDTNEGKDARGASRLHAELGAGYPKHFECRWRGSQMTLHKRWEGRPQGPQCQCNPGSFGNWIRIKAHNAEVSGAGTAPLDCRVKHGG